jgi:hypothetical protein
VSSIEKRLERDIAAVTGGVVVTESDLHDARDAVEERLETGQRNRSRALAAIAAAAVVIPILGVAAFQSLGDDAKTAPPASSVTTTSPNPDDAFLTGTAPTPDILNGVWRVDNSDTLVQFATDGSFRATDRGRLFSDPAVRGTWVISGDLITVSVEGGTADCAGQTWAILASLYKPGRLRFVQDQAAAPDCSYGPGERGALEQVLPTNNEWLAGLVLSTEGPWKPTADRSALLYGDWMAEGGGHVLELAPGGAYYVADESAEVVDSGQWSTRGSQLSLTSSAASGECTNGDRLTWGGLELANPGTSVMRGSVEQNTCGGAWASTVWILLPDRTAE